MCHDIPEHSTAATLATDTGFGTHKMCAAGAHFSKRKTQIQKIIFAPKAHLHSSAKVRYLGFEVSACSTDGLELRSDRRTACTPSHELSSEHSFARTHRMAAQATTLAARHVLNLKPPAR